MSKQDGTKPHCELPCIAAVLEVATNGIVCFSPILKNELELFICAEYCNGGYLDNCNPE